MSNVLSEEKKQQVIALGKLGWPLRRIEQATGVRRETAGAYLKAAGIAVRPPGAWGRRAPAKPANEVTPDLADSKPANEVTPTLACRFHLPRAIQRSSHQCLRAVPRTDRAGAPSWTQCQGHLAGPGFRSRIFRQLSDGEAFCSQASMESALPEAVGIIQTAAGEEAQVDYGSVRWCATRKAASTDERDCSC